ncbi:hypothetical protein L1049_025169 [Liquidambar formosana]|uniref:Uncharacterized protein n=1 Tax=Liquidambar formosana TaxID=63359 RepID=A0AAP0X0B7_LIQFO
MDQRKEAESKDSIHCNSSMGGIRGLSIQIRHSCIVGGNVDCHFTVPLGQHSQRRAPELVETGNYRAVSYGDGTFISTMD